MGVQLSGVIEAVAVGVDPVRVRACLAEFSTVVEPVAVRIDRRWIGLIVVDLNPINQTVAIAIFGQWVGSVRLEFQRIGNPVGIRICPIVGSPDLEFTVVSRPSESKSPAISRITVLIVDLSMTSRAMVSALISTVNGCRPIQSLGHVVR